MENYPLVTGDIVINLFIYILIFLFGALVRDELVHFLFYNSYSLLCVANRVSHLARFLPLSSEIGKSDTSKKSKYVV
nr:MAG TPA: hypothetical protein [Microviridae sp.]